MLWKEFSFCCQDVRVHQPCESLWSAFQQPLKSCCCVTYAESRQCNLECLLAEFLNPHWVFQVCALPLGAYAFFWGSHQWLQAVACVKSCLLHVQESNRISACSWFLCRVSFCLTLLTITSVHITRGLCPIPQASDQGSSVHESSCQIKLACLKGTTWFLVGFAATG